MNNDPERDHGEDRQAARSDAQGRGDVPLAQHKHDEAAHADPPSNQRENNEDWQRRFARYSLIFDGLLALTAALGSGVLFWQLYLMRESNALTQEGIQLAKEGAASSAADVRRSLEASERSARAAEKAAAAVEAGAALTRESNDLTRRSVSTAERSFDASRKMESARVIPVNVEPFDLRNDNAVKVVLRNDGRIAAGAVTPYFDLHAGRTGRERTLVIRVGKIAADRADLAPGETARFTFEISREEISQVEQAMETDVQLRLYLTIMVKYVDALSHHTDVFCFTWGPQDDQDKWGRCAEG